jgi:hypothetical protein
MKSISLLLLSLVTVPFANAQQATQQATTPATQTATDTITEFKPSGKLWGYAFGDLAYKGNSDNVNNGGRGGSNQYTKVPINSNLFQWRRIYLGYNYDISKKFSAEFLLAAEDDFAGGSLGQASSGDVLTNNKFSPYVKLANLRWKNIFKGTDLVVGQVSTPSFPMMSEAIWGYRSIERTVSDIRRTPSFDMGATLQGHFDKNSNFGYDLMVGNGQSAKPENDAYKWYYGDVWAKFFNKRLVIDFYQDYQRMNWNPQANGQAEVATTSGSSTTYALPTPANFHHDRNMSKLFVAWTDKNFTIGVEAFQNTMMGDVAAVGEDHKVYYLSTKATAVSVFARGRVYKDKLSAFARYDNYDPSHNLKAVTDNSKYISYSALTSQYEPTTKEQFVTVGLDYTPMKNVHIMPNMWMNTYQSALSASSYSTSYNPNISGVKGTDVVWRLTFYYIYGK